VLMIAGRTNDVGDLNQRAREHMRAHGQLRGADVEIGERSFSIGDDVVARKNDPHLGVVNGDRAQIIDMEPGRITVQHNDGRQTDLPETYARDGHLDHGYAVTAHRAQGATVDRTFVLGGQDSYREWGYTAMTRHRDRADFYITAEQPFLNRGSEAKLDRDELTDTVQRAFHDRRKQELAIDAYDRLPHIAADVERLAETNTKADEIHERMAATERELEETSWVRRGTRDDLKAHLERDHHDLDRLNRESHKQLDRLDEHLDHQLDHDPKPARDPYQDLDDVPFDRGPDLEIPRGPDLDIDLGPDLGPDIGM
jgi:hypothetical protein